jgi:integrase
MKRRRPIPPFLKVWTDKRNGKRYVSFRKRGHKSVPLPQPIGSDEFWIAYNAALKGRIEVGAEWRSTAGSVSAALAAYFGSHQWGALSVGTQGYRRAILERFRERYGQWLLRQLTENFLLAYLESLKPHAAGNHLTALRGFLDHAKHDAARNIKLRRIKSDGIHAWTEEEIAQFEAYHAVGTKARLALALALYTAQRRGDISRMGRQHVRNGILEVRQEKTGVVLQIPLHTDLRAILDATPSEHLTFLTTRSGKPYHKNDLSYQFRAWCDEAGLPQRCSIHGLRKAAARRLAEAGCSSHEIGAITGHRTLKELERYTRSAEQARLAKQAMARQENKPS